LSQVTDAAGRVTEYTYDGAPRMLTITDPRHIIFLTNEYDTSGRMIEQTQADSTTFQFAYTLDGAATSCRPTSRIRAATSIGRCSTPPATR
jgi:YD repeat-containing protein